MFPLYDTTPRRTFPFINYLIIVANIFVFFVQLSAPDFEKFVTQYAFNPSLFNLTDPSTYTMVFTSIFMHGGIAHLLSNMWFLHIFGDNVEDSMGHFSYLLFYLAAGFVATLTQYLLMTHTAIPLLGASGAISGVGGAYFLYYKRSSVKALVTLIIIWTIVEIPVWLFLGYWFFIQILSGLGSLAAYDANGGGVAWFAHIGGFVFGYVVAKFFKPLRHRDIYGDY